MRDRVTGKLGSVPRTYWWATVIYLVLAALFIHDWDGYVFQRTVRDFWDGQSPYTVAERAPYYTFLNIEDTSPQWYAYPPLPLLAMAFTYAPSIFLDLPPAIDRVLIKAPMIAGTLALAAVAVAWTRHLGSDKTTTDRVRNLLLFNPFLILVGPVWGMTDPALLALVLAGTLRFLQGHPRQAGLLWGFGLLVKPFPFFLALPLVAYFVHHHGWRRVATATATGVAAFAAVCLPFVATNPDAFWRQVVGMHLARNTQGLSWWSIDALQDVGPDGIRIASLVLLGTSLLVLSVLAPRLRGAHAPILLLLAAGVQVLLWNRVVNEQYLVLVVAPLLLLYGTNHLPVHAATPAIAHGVPGLFALITIVQGSHYVTFIPPDLALALFQRPVDVLANQVGGNFDWGWNEVLLKHAPSLGVAMSLIVLAWIALRTARLEPRRPGRRATPLSPSTASILGCVMLVLVGIAPLATPYTGEDGNPPGIESSTEPRIGAFYYLWWNNAAHDPDVHYGNWLGVSQHPEIGYYTNTRGVARDHAYQMRAHGIDVAIVSYHTPELERYQVFQEEAADAGLLVAPLIELNQVYDVEAHRPRNESGETVTYAAYQPTNDTRDAIVEYVLELRDQLDAPNSYRIGGRPVIYFYDSYVSSIGFGEGERLRLAQALLDLRPVEELRAVFGDPSLDATPESLLRHYPTADVERFPEIYPPRDMKGFYFLPIDPATDAPANQTVVQDREGTKRLAHSALWRAAHLHLHKEFWAEVRAGLEAELGSLFLVGGDAFNEQAGFAAGTVKSLEDLEVFDGAFIYSPSFTWGVQPRNPDGTLEPPFEDTFRLWEDRNLWLTGFANGMGRHSAFGIAPAYDDRVNRPTTGFVIPREYDGVNYTYARSWDSTLVTRPTLPVIATFNEFFEGSSIEPDTQDGDRFLEVTRAYADRLSDARPPTEAVVAVVHERWSRINPDAKYSETDLPHWWGLRLVSAAARARPDAALWAIDGLQEAPQATPSTPRFLLIDGGRDDYGSDAFSPDVLAAIRGWVEAGVPTLVFGREVAPSLRAMVPSSCQRIPGMEIAASPGRVANASMRLADADDESAHLDRFWVDASGRILLERDGVAYTAGLRCEDSNVAFVNIKPWGPRPVWATTMPSDEACVSVLLRGLFPENATAPETAGCTVRAD